eukprot:1452386-Rhodomonas_salina.1
MLSEAEVGPLFRKKQVLQEVCVLLASLTEALDREDRALEALSGRAPDYALARSLVQESYSCLCGTGCGEQEEGAEGSVTVCVVCAGS